MNKQKEDYKEEEKINDFNVNIYSQDGEEWTIIMDNAPCCYYMPLDEALNFLKERIKVKAVIINE
jgi:hypothetical protein